ncbi:MAG: thiamine-monophosphate kinase [Proteobacteria bacterium]|nr:thiamine-monophosphate kinase [Pseudomonadota bacterium]
MNEAEFLAALRGLPLHGGAHGLTDDTASLAGLTITTDTIVEGVHFLPDDPPGDVAWKLVAVNLSDLAAKGATPEGALLNYPLSRSPAQAGAQSETKLRAAARSALRAETGPRPSPGKGEDWDDAFLSGFSEVLTAFDCTLLGGDIVSLPPDAPLVITLTAFGRNGVDVPRSGAKAGDSLWVTGTIGDAGAGLRIARGEAGPPDLLAAYRRPQPHLAEGRALVPLVHAMMDVSDGLVLDASRMAAASGLAVTIDLALVPLSASYRAFSGDRMAAVTAGDDYQLLFAAPAGFAPPVPATCIGSFTPGGGLTLTDGGEPVPLPPTLGFQH